MSSVEIPQLQLKRPTQKVKGPAEVAASPSHGSRKLGEQPMNEKDASTTTPEMANRAPIFELEDPTIEMGRFASILSHLTDGLFARSRRERGRFDGDVVLRATDSSIDDVEFVVGQIYVLAKKIDAMTTRAINAQIAAEGGGAVAGGPAIARLVARLKGGESPMEIAHVAADLARGVAA